jgi:tetratricopeptide (TPR) repeat protein
LDVVARLQEPFIVEIVSGFSPNRTVLARHEISPSVRRPHLIDYHKLAELEESLSRKEFVEGLKKAGYKGQPNHRDESVEVPEQVERLLGEMNFLSQFQALQELHRLMRTKGESSAVLGGLVRGYANLGVLTEYYWHPAHKVFKARALLYGQRMFARDATSPVAQWHRGYAAAMAGLHWWALADLERADNAWNAIAEKDRPSKPAWAKFIGPFCHYDVEELGKHVKDPQAGQLAALLRFVAVDQVGGRVWPVQTALEALETNPECYRVHDTLCEFGGVSVLHAATLQSVALAGETIYNRLDRMSGLPEKVGTVVAAKKILGAGLWGLLVKSQPQSLEGEFAVRRALMDALRDSGAPAAANQEGKTPAASDSIEPSWAVLGLLIRELSFMQVYRRASFEHDQWGVPTEEWLAKSSPLVEGHPFRAFLNTYAWTEEKREEASDQLAQVDVSGIDMRAAPLYRRFSAKNDITRLKQFLSNEDLAVGDLVATLRYMPLSRTKDVKWLSGALLHISPFSPMARTMLIRCDWKGVQPQIEQWDREAAPYPGLLAALAERYAATGRLDDAERCLKAAVKILPGDAAAWHQLADVYRRRGQMDRWLATLEEYLQKPDYHLDHFGAQADIANYFMERKEWEKALPYAQGAAECYSAFGLGCAAKCYEGLQRWGEAEKYYRACAERYERESLEWYYFCRRTGQGDVASARSFARDYIDKGKQRAVRPTPSSLMTFYLLEKEPEKALAELKHFMATNSVPYDVLWAAVTADLLKDGKKRDALLQQAKALGDKLNNAKRADKANPADESTLADNGAGALADLILKDLAQGGKGQIDLEAADKLADSLVPWYHAWFHYLLGQYLDVHGRHESADRCWKQCMSWPRSGIHRTLAGAMLLEHGVKPADYRALMQQSSVEGEKP